MVKILRRKSVSPKVAAIFEDEALGVLKREEQANDPNASPLDRVEQLRHAVKSIVDKLEQLHPTQLGRPIWTPEEKHKMGIE